jgi:hypothetical protein
MHLIAILVMIAGLLGSFLTYIGLMHAGSLTVWGVVAAVGVVATVFTRRAAD